MLNAISYRHAMTCLVLIVGLLFSYGQSKRSGTCFTVEKAYPDSKLDGYNMYLPPSYEENSSNFPVIVFLQGGLGVGGEVSAIFNWALPRILKETQRIETELDELRMNTFIYVMPHIQQGQFYQNTEAIAQMLDELIQTYRIDPQRIYLTGLSRGGHGSWGVASQIPERFAAIAPICGALHGVESYEGLAELPIWAAHNEADNIVDYRHTVRAVSEIERIAETSFHRASHSQKVAWENHSRIFVSSSNSVKPHDAWTEVYDEIHFYHWLLRFKKE